MDILKTYTYKNITIYQYYSGWFEYYTDRFNKTDSLPLAKKGIDEYLKKNKK